MNKHIDHNFEKRVSNINKQRGQDKQLKQYYDVRSGEYMWIEDYEEIRRFKPLKKKPNIFVRILAKIVSIFRRRDKY